MMEVDPLIGKQLASFRIERVQGRGGMATVYYGWDVKLERPVAIKVIATHYVGDAAYAARFVNEARVIATWHHPNILQVYYADDQDGLYYFVMEYIDGQDLGAILDQYRKEGRHMPAADVIRIGRAVANALDYAHDRGVIHRDVKPTNVMVAHDGRVVLADFGIAMNVAMGTIGTVFGSPHYFSPEQARSSADVVPQSDLYSLGIILYEMLTGQVPFDDPSPLALAMQQIERLPPLPSTVNPALSPAVENVLLKALQKKPEDRYQTGRQMMDALGLALDVPEPTLPFLERPPARVQAHVAPAGKNSTADGAGGVKRAGAAAGAALAALALAAKRGMRAMAPRVATARVAAKDDLRAVAKATNRGAHNLETGLEASLSRLRTNPTVRTAIQRLRQDPQARLVAGGIALLLVAAIIVWMAGANFPAFRAAEPTPESSEAAAEASATAEQATETPPTDSPPEPGQGDHFAVYYNDTSFYFKNDSKNDREISPVAFERVLGDGTFANRFDGTRWAQIYHQVQAGRCMVLELVNYRDHLAPKDCKNKHQVWRSPNANDEFVFWTTQEGSTQFRVLWNDAEVGRCEIAAKYCDVYLP
jgi:hypothetical protein